MPTKRGKKKQAANPARGFATTSVASKGKVSSKATGKPEEGLDNSTLVLPQSDTHSGPCEGKAPEESLQLHQLSPRELGEQLEQSELQMLLEKHISKVDKESTRQATRLQTDRRVSRPQSLILNTNEWLKEAYTTKLLDCLGREMSYNSKLSESKDAIEQSDVEGLTARTWTLHKVLANIGFSDDQSFECLRWVLRSKGLSHPDLQNWGLQEALDWLALNCDPADLPSYDGHKSSTGSSLPNSRLDTPPNEQSESEITGNHDSVNAKFEQVTRGPDHDDSEDSEDAEVSDLDSDVEPDQMVLKYVSIKLRLLQLDRRGALSSDVKGRLTSHKGKDVSGLSRPSSAVVAKLNAKLQTIESDILFDKRTAQEQWKEARNHFEKDSAARRRLQLPQVPSPLGRSQHDDIIKGTVPGDREKDQVVAALRTSSSEEEEEAEVGGLLGSVFDTEDQVGREGASSDNERSKIVSTVTVVRDLGDISGGISPSRILEEACRARDTNVKIILRQISPTSFACRHALDVRWSKDQALVSSSLPFVSCTSERRYTMFAMTELSTANMQQSEAFIATAALFLIFGTSPKEEKAHLRLPKQLKNVWAEFVDLKKEQDDTFQRNQLQRVRKMVQDLVEQDQEDGLVVTESFKKRADKSGISREEVQGVDGLAESPVPVDMDVIRAQWLQKTKTPSYQKMLLMRMKLPIFNFREQILSAVENNQVVILCGETGCGKSTQLPSFILEGELSRGRPCKIYCTEPRRISAISLAQRVSEELGEHWNDLGTPRSLVGYAIRLESHVSSQTRLIYATVGIVLRMLESHRNLDDVTHLVIDEVHERSIDTDFLLVVVRSLMLRRPELKVILMSATVDAQRFSNYLHGAPILNVPGRTFPVQTRFLEDAIELTGYTNDTTYDGGDIDGDEFEEGNNDRGQPGIADYAQYSKATKRTVMSYNEYRIDYELIIKLIEKIAYDSNYNRYSKAILIFLPGMAEIRQLHGMLMGHPSFSDRWLLYALHSAIASGDQQQAFQVPPPGIRKVVLATNIAETGITIPDITAVVDTCKHKEMRFDERRQLSRLVQSFISKANAKQRRGRAGRVQEGICFHLVTKQRHDKLMAEQQTPEILRLSLQDLVMRVKICGLGDIERTLSDALDPPASKNIRRAIDALIEVGALSTSEYLTPLGVQLAKLPLDAILGKLVLYAAIFGCLDVGLTVAAILSSKSPFLEPIEARQRADAAKMAFKRGDSDILTVYNAYSAWRRVCNTPGMSELDFCRKNFLSQQNLSAIEDLKGQLLSSLTEAGFVKLTDQERASSNRSRPSFRQRTFVTVPSVYNINNENDLLTTAVIAWAFYPKLLIRDGKGWRNISSSQSVGLPPTSVLKAGTAANFLSYHHIMQASSKYYNAHSTSAVHELPLLLLAGDADFRLYAGVIVLDGNRLRFAAKDWKTMLVLKTLRLRTEEIVNKALKAPNKPLGDRLEGWKEMILKLFVRGEDGALGRK